MAAAGDSESREPRSASHYFMASRIAGGLGVRAVHAEPWRVLLGNLTLTDLLELAEHFDDPAPWSTFVLAHRAIRQVWDNPELRIAERDLIDLARQHLEHQGLYPLVRPADLLGRPPHLFVLIESVAARAGR